MPERNRRCHLDRCVAYHPTDGLAMLPRALAGTHVDPSLPGEQGPGGEAESWIAAMYADLRRIARHHLARGGPTHTLQATALLNEVWLKLAARPGAAVRDRAHFAALVSRVMRQILVDHARRKLAERRGGGSASTSISLSELPDREPAATVDVLLLDDTLRELSQLSLTKARLVELRFFAGLTESEAAEVLGMSRTEATRQWRMARAWLAQRLRVDGE